LVYFILCVIDERGQHPKRGIFFLFHRNRPGGPPSLPSLPAADPF
jgi:hypothetical protein